MSQFERVTSLERLLRRRHGPPSGGPRMTEHAPALPEGVGCLTAQLAVQKRLLRAAGRRIDSPLISMGAFFVF